MAKRAAAAASETKAATRKRPRTPLVSKDGFGGGGSEKPRSLQAKRGYSVAHVNGIRANSAANNFLSQLVEAYSPSEDTLQRRTEVASQGKGELLQYRAQLNAKIAQHTKEAKELLLLGKRKAAENQNREALRCQEELDRIQPTIDNLEAAHGKLNQAKLQSKAAGALMLQHDVMRHYGAEVDNDAAVNLLEDMEEEMTNIDGAGDVLGQPIGADLKTANSSVEEATDALDQLALNSELPDVSRSLPPETRSEMSPHQRLRHELVASTSTSPRGGGGGNSTMRSTSHGELERMPEQQQHFDAIVSQKRRREYQSAPLSPVLEHEPAAVTAFDISGRDDDEIPLKRKPSKKHKQRMKRVFASTDLRAEDFPSPPTTIPRNKHPPSPEDDSELCDDLLNSE